MAAPANNPVRGRTRKRRSRMRMRTRSRRRRLRRVEMASIAFDKQGMCDPHAR